ncbi:MAG: hypothetical protein ACN4GF_01210, partial [Lentimonas sp.]
VDLFANAAKTIRMAETDFLIIPLGKYEDASSIVIRRISGRVEMAGLLLFPVVSEVVGEPQIEKELIELFGDAPSSKYRYYLDKRLVDAADAFLADKDAPVSANEALGDISSLTAELPFVLLKGEGRGAVDVFFIPMEFPSSLAIRLAEDLEQELGIEIVVSVQMGTSTEMYELNLNQYNTRRIFAEGLVILHRIKNQDKTPYAVILTSKDINSPPYNLRFNFATHSPAGMSVVSTARMDNRNYGLRDDSEQLYSRLKKMVKKSIGFGHLGYTRSLDRDSVMYSPIMSIQDLDEIGTDY